MVVPFSANTEFNVLCGLPVRKVGDFLTGFTLFTSSF